MTVVRLENKNLHRKARTFSHFFTGGSALIIGFRFTTGGSKSCLQPGQKGSTVARPKEEVPSTEVIVQLLKVNSPKTDGFWMKTLHGFMVLWWIFLARWSPNLGILYRARSKLRHRNRGHVPIWNLEHFQLPSLATGKHWAERIECWLVVWTPRKILVNWDDYSQYMGKYKMFQTTNQFLFRMFGCSKNKFPP